MTSRNDRSTRLVRVFVFLATIAVAGGIGAYNAFKSWRQDEEFRRAVRGDMSIDQAAKDLESGSVLTKCIAAGAIGRQRAREHAPALRHLLSTSIYAAVRACAADALIDLGEPDTALAAYIEWIRGDDLDRRHFAIIGFGQLGPSAADETLPHLATVLKSPRMEERDQAVRSLAKIGPAAVPLLMVAARDPHPQVSTRASHALADMK